MSKGIIPNKRSKYDIDTMFWSDIIAFPVTSCEGTNTRPDILELTMHALTSCVTAPN